MLMKQKRLLLLLVLLMTAVTGAWAQSSASAYSNALNTDEDFSSMTNIDAKDDATDTNGLWLRMDNLVTYNYHKDNAADDWLVTPAIELQAGVTYTIALDAIKPSPQDHTYTETFEVKVATAATDATAAVLSAGSTAIATTEVTTSWTNYHGTFTPTTSGTYYVGIHATSPADQNMFSIRNLFVGIRYYSVSVNDGTAMNPATWKAKVGDATEFGKLPLENVVEGQTVTLTYGGRMKVKSVTAVTDAAPPAPVEGNFTINANGDKVVFAPGNLQYQASTNTWRFAENQWDYVGSGNSSISSTNTGWIDLFGWGTSGHQFASGYGSAYQPWATNQTDTNYGPTDLQYNLTGDYAQGDWGTNMGSGWRTLKSIEWKYVFEDRTTTSGIRFAKAKVNDVNGVILLPDDWSTEYYSLNATNMKNDQYGSNLISQADWINIFAPHGAVFLPAAGFRGGTSVQEPGVVGYYWTASSNTTQESYAVRFGNNYLERSGYQRHYGRSVRLAKAAE